MTRRDPQRPVIAVKLRARVPRSRSRWPRFYRELGALRRLEALTVSDSWITDSALAAIEQCKDLRAIDISSNREVTDSGVSRLARLTNLRELNLAFTGVTDNGVAALAGLSELHSLDLGGTCITAGGLRHVRRMQELRVLRLPWTSAMQSVTYLETLRHLEVLDLSHSGVAATGLSPLAGAKAIKKLDLSYTDASDECLRILQSWAT